MTALRRRFLPHKSVEVGREPLRHRPGQTGADRAAVDLDHWDHLSGRSGQEAFVGGVEVVPDKRLLATVDPGGHRQLHHGVAGDAFEDPGIGGRSEQPT